MSSVPLSLLLTGVGVWEPCCHFLCPRASANRHQIRAGLCQSEPVLGFTRGQREPDKDITCRRKRLDLNCIPLQPPTPSPPPTKIVIWRQGFFLSFAHNYAPFHLPPCSPWPLTLGSVARISHSPRADNVPFRVDEEGHSCQGRQECSEQSNHSITLCPHLSQLLPKHPNISPRSSHQRPRDPDYTASASAPCGGTEGNCVTHEGEKTRVVIHQYSGDTVGNPPEIFFWVLQSHLVQIQRI